MRQPVVAANWKMHGSLELCERYAAELQLPADVEVWVFPTALHLASLNQAIKGKKTISTGAQNVWYEVEGAYTGEISAEMVATTGSSFVLVGHSERRMSFGDSDSVVAKKFKSILQAGLEPVLCIGETLAERESGHAFKAVDRQLAAVESAWDEADYKHKTIAYEPVWAIGTGRAATAEIAQEMQEHIREHVRECGTGQSEHVRILYGGSVKASNASELFMQDDVDGFLVGGASLDVDEFSQICEAVAN